MERGAAAPAGAPSAAGWVLEEPDSFWKSIVSSPPAGAAAGAASGRGAGSGSFENWRFISSSGSHTAGVSACLGAAACAGFATAAGAGSGGSGGGLTAAGLGGAAAREAAAGAAAGFGAAGGGAAAGGVGGVGAGDGAGGALRTAGGGGAATTGCTCAIGAWSSSLKLRMKVSTAACCAAGGSAPMPADASGGKGCVGGFGAAWLVCIMRCSASTCVPGMARGTTSVDRAGRTVLHSQDSRGRWLPPPLAASRTPHTAPPAAGAAEVVAGLPAGQAVEGGIVLVGQEQGAALGAAGLRQPAVGHAVLEGRQRQAEAFVAVGAEGVVREDGPGLAAQDVAVVPLALGSRFRRGSREGIGGHTQAGLRRLWWLAQLAHQPWCWLGAPQPPVVVPPLPSQRPWAVRLAPHSPWRRSRRRRAVTRVRHSPWLWRRRPEAELLAPLPPQP